MFNRFRSYYLGSILDGLLYAAGDGGSGGGAPAGGEPAGQPAAGAPAGQPAGAPAGQPAAGAPAGQPAAGAPAGQFVYTEDRSKWIPPEKYKASETLINRTASDIERLRAEIKERDRRIAALAGVAPASEDEAEAAKVAAAFYALPQFAHLKGITPEWLASVKALVDEGATLTEARDHIYNQQADRFLDSLDVKFAEEIGATNLTPGQQRKLRAAFGASMPDKREDPDGFAKFQARYNRGDETLIDEFVKEYVGDMLEPARRQATVPLAQRHVVPRGGRSVPVVAAAEKPDYSKMSVREMLDNAEKEAERLGR